MELEAYLDFLGRDDIRIRGTRIGIEYLLSAYQEGAGPEEIVLRYPTLTLEQVHAAITYYLHNRAAMEAYLHRWREEGEAAWQREEAASREFGRLLRRRIGVREDGSEPSVGTRPAMPA